MPSIDRFAVFSLKITDFFLRLKKIFNEIECHSTCYQKAVQVSQKWEQYLRLRVEKNNSRTSTLLSLKFASLN